MKITDVQAIRIGEEVSKIFSTSDWNDDTDTPNDDEYIELFDNASDIEEALDNLQEYIEECNGFDKEVIYYSNAMEILSEHDASLYDSMQLASEFDYDTSNLNSEILATLLISDKAVNEWHDTLRNDVEIELCCILD